MRTIHKYYLHKIEVQSIDVPVAAKFLKVGLSPGGGIAAWFEVDNEKTHIMREICLFGTGWEMPDCDLHYLGTVVDGEHVWHVYEKTSVLPLTLSDK